MPLPMPTPPALVERIRAVRNRARAALLLRGMGWLAALVVGCFVAAAVADRTIHFHDPTVRLSLLLGLVSGGVAAAWWLLVAPLRTPLTDIDVAMRVEDRFGGFDEGLASSLQFLESGRNPSLGSPDLQERVIAETVRRSDRLNFRETVRLGAALPAIAAAACVAAVAAGLAWQSPASAALALRRFFTPYSAPAWPRATNLRLLTVDFQPIDPDRKDPFKIIRGRSLELLVEDRDGRLPDEVVLEYRMPDDAPLREPLRHASLRDRAGALHDVCLVSLPADRGPVLFRAVGGDDESMPELEMLVVLPPVVETLRVTLTPPRYTARPVQTLPPGDGRIRGIVGTKVAFEGRSSKPLASASVRIKGQPAGTTTVLADPHLFRGTFALAEAGVYPYAFQMNDVEGIANAEAPRYEIEAAQDAVPEVTIDVPPGDMTVTADAEVPVAVSAKDDLGLRDLSLRFNVGDSTDVQPKSLTLAKELPRLEHHRVSIVWPLSGLAASEGMRIAFHAEAGDWFDLGPPHVGKSMPRMLTVVGAKQKEAEIVLRQADLLHLLERAEKAQSQTRDQTVDIDVQFDKAGRLKPSDVDLLKRVQTDQGDVSRLLANPPDGAANVVRGLLDELRLNHVKSPQTRTRLERLDRELSDLRDSHLPAIDNQLTRAAKSAELKNQSSDRGLAADLSKSLKAARREQGIVLRSLQTMLGDLAQWRDSEGVHEGLRELVEGQEKINNETAELSHSTLAKTLADLTKQEQADLARLAEREAQLAEQVERLKQRLRDSADNLKKSNREAAQDAAASLKSLERADPQTRMREIAGQLARNNVGEAMARQQQLLNELRKLDTALAERPETDLQSLVARMAEAQHKIDTLRKDQESLRKKTQELARGSDPKSAAPELERLRKEQARLQEAAEETARELRRLGLDAGGGPESPAENLRQAGAHMAQAQEELEQERGPSPSTDVEQKQAIAELDRARAGLARSQRRATQQLARQSLVRVADELAGLAARQKGVLDETTRLDGERVQLGRLTRGQLRFLQANAQVESRLHDETLRIADRLENADVYVWILRRAAGEMQGTAERLGTQLTDAKTVALATSAWTRLRDLLAALKPDRPDESSQGPEGEENDDRENAPPASADGIPLLAQLKLLKSLQQGLLVRTGELDRRRQGATESSKSAAEAELQRLAVEQGELASLARRVMAEATRAAESARPKSGRREKQEK